MSLTNHLIMWNFPVTGTSVQGGTRPAYVIKDFGKKLLICPVTSKKKNGQRTHYVFTNKGRESVILTEQLFTVRKPKDSRDIGCLSRDDRKKVMECLMISVGLTPIVLQRPVHPKVFRGQVFKMDDKEYVVIQNNVGNAFAPTTIVARIKRNEGERFEITGIKTISEEKLITPIGELRTNMALRRYLS